MDLDSALRQASKVDRGLTRRKCRESETEMRSVVGCKSCVRKKSALEIKSEDEKRTKKNEEKCDECSMYHERCVMVDRRLASDARVSHYEHPYQNKN